MSDERHARISARAIQRLETLDDVSFVRLCYNTILDREPDAGGMKAQLAALDAGHSRLEIVEALFNSPEFDARNPDDASAARRKAFLDAGGFLDPTTRNLLNSVAARLDPRRSIHGAPPPPAEKEKDEEEAAEDDDVIIRVPRRSISLRRRRSSHTT